MPRKPKQVIVGEAAPSVTIAEPEVELVVVKKEPRAKKPRTAEQIEKDKERMAKVRAAKLKKT